MFDYQSVLFKKIGKGKYAYLRNGPFRSKACIVNEEEREKIITISSSLMKFVLGLSLVFVPIALKCPMAIIAWIVTGIAVIIYVWLSKLRPILKGKELIDFPAYSVLGYIEKRVAFFSWKYILRFFLYGVIFILLCSWVLYHDYLNSNIISWGAFFVGIFFLFTIVGFIFQLIQIWFKAKESIANFKRRRD